MASSDVYLVDDHPLTRYGLRSFLLSAGHQVVGETDDPSEALTDVTRLNPTLLLLDLQLGIHSGFDLLGMIHGRKLRTRTIVLTVSEDPHDVAEALRLGAAGYVHKAAAGQELLNAIDAVLQGDRFLGVGVSVPDANQPEPPATNNVIASLSARERQIIEMVVKGCSSAEIAASLGLSPKTVDSYRSRLMAKVGVADVPALVRFAIRAGLLQA
jgi:DNA-binding NarL/FixJ family response regulator